MKSINPNNFINSLIDRPDTAYKYSPTIANKHQLSNKEKKQIEEEQRKIEEFSKYETAYDAKNKNKNLLHFTVRFPHKRVDDLEYKPF